MTDIMQEIQFADLEYSGKIDKIYHISDIHIRLQKRHDEYKKVFTNLYKQLLQAISCIQKLNYPQNVLVLQLIFSKNYPRLCL